MELETNVKLLVKSDSVPFLPRIPNTNDGKKTVRTMKKDGSQTERPAAREKETTDVVHSAFGFGKSRVRQLRSVEMATVNYHRFQTHKPKLIKQSSAPRQERSVDLHKRHILHNRGRPVETGSPARSPSGVF